MKKITYKLAVIIILFVGFLAKAQTKISYKDTLDGKFDASTMIDNAKGFIPVPILVTEAALGGIGVGLLPLYISPQKKPIGDEDYIAPTITSGFFAYTANKSWFTGIYRRGTLDKLQMKYKLFAGYIDLNLNYYKEIENVGEVKYSFNNVVVPVLVSLSKRIPNQKSYFGFEYMRYPLTLTPNFERQDPPIIPENEFKKHIAAFTTFIDWDQRNTVFTPDNGYRLNFNYSVNDNWTGSDYDFQRLEGFFHYFTPIKSNWISGFRLEGQSVFGDVPFHQLPTVKLRGIPAYRYQGTTIGLFETEQRYDLNLRWSVLGFAGTAMTLQKNQNFSDAKWVYNAGTGFRYLIARTYGLRMGLDLAVGPGSFGYYIVVGQKWSR
ncbi:BamA/TamA family outer membrane protein [Flavobacterium gilvum]|uniref:Bacterial surface antigen (D15) domain-containing protein n=1 Tax=Flavobacterium gilvum TaxID=1492737 RepID=A0AAC9I825_9FLAO|nr:BamA/TamA family outer membrane protein [Flavobacterium gilvum]AOW10628.1 hypothetical protein EM308_14625 [Flavobacterium gilvum]KFC59075.1 hypothetical protein FEM08_21490 [Flavobacterium gilvum]